MRTSGRLGVAAAGGLLLIATAAACGDVQQAHAPIGPGAVMPPIGAPAIAPTADNIVGPAIQVGGGNTAVGPYRAWIYRTNDGMTCFELTSSGSGSSSCGSDAGSVTGASVTTTSADVWVTGGTTNAGAVAVVVTLADGSTVRAPVVLAAPGVVEAGTRFYVVGLPATARPMTAAIVDATGTVVETANLGP